MPPPTRPVIVDGPRTWEMVRDNQGHREYRIRHIVLVDVDQGPARALGCPGLPQPGEYWSFGQDLDQWAWCRKNAIVRPLVENEPNELFEIEQIFSTKPLKEGECEELVGDPLLIKPKIKIRFNKHREESHSDRLGKPILNPAFEQIRGPAVEFDKSRPTIMIEMNVGTDILDLVDTFMDTLNDDVMWGFSKRCVKLSGAQAEKRYYGQVAHADTGTGTGEVITSCTVYWNWQFELETNHDTFDRDILAEGTKVLHGEWDPVSGNWITKPVGFDEVTGLVIEADPTNPKHFIAFPDRQGNHIRGLLKADGTPAGPDEAYYIHVENDVENNLFALGLPASLND